MNLLDNELYQEDLKYIANLDLPWDKLKNKSILLSGATGMIGSFLIDSIMYINRSSELGCKIYAMGRKRQKAKDRFDRYWDDELFCFVEHNINHSMDAVDIDKVNYVIHLASNTHPLAYSQDPIGTITTNIFGIYNMLEFAYAHKSDRVAFASSNEIYGENRGDVEKFDEKYCGYIDCNTMRAGYPESKRCGEALCQAYIAQRGMDIVIPRLTRSYGPTLLDSDSKALSQFLKKGLAGENIVLKSAGTQFYSYTYVADAVAGLLYVLLKGEKGEAYNIADEASDIMLKNLAMKIADECGSKVVFEVPDGKEAIGYSVVTKARLESKKIGHLGFCAKYDIEKGLKRTITIMTK